MTSLTKQLTGRVITKLNNWMSPYSWTASVEKLLNYNSIWTLRTGSPKTPNLRRY